MDLSRPAAYWNSRWQSVIFALLILNNCATSKFPVMRYRINSPGVIQETIDGEAVVVNLASGTYYSLDGAGSVLWNLLIDGADSGEVVQQLEQIFDADRATLEKAVADLTAQLVQESLIIPSDNAAFVAPASTSANERVPFVAPVLSSYTDMQELLLLDPIHDVGERGWPHTNSSTSPGQ